MVDTIFQLIYPACYFERIEPAVETFRSSGDPTVLVDLLREGQDRLRGVPDYKHPHGPASDRFDEIQDALDVIEGRQFYRPSTNHVPVTPGDRTTVDDLKHFIEFCVYDDLFTSLCVAFEEDCPPEVVLTRGRLLPYLYEHSPSLQDAFACGGLQGKSLALFPSMELLSKAAVADLLEQIEAVPPPDDAEEMRKAEAKLESLRGTAKVFVSSQFADIFGPSVSSAMSDFKHLLRTSLAKPELAIIQEFG